MPEMMALRAHWRGGPDVLAYEAVRRPGPGAGEVLIEVHAAGVTFDELSWERTWFHAGVARVPVVPSHEVSGVVAGLGSGVTDFRVGDAVCGVVRFDYDGAAAEYVVAPAADLTSKPASVSHSSAAALSLAALTAWQALVSQAGLKRGDQVLVQGGAGGVGSFAVQLAAQLGGQVTATARDTDLDVVRGLGAARALDFTVPARPHGQVFDVVLDTVGGPVLDASYALVRPGGRLISLPLSPVLHRASELDIQASSFETTPDRFELARLLRLAERDELRVLVAQAVPLHLGRDAYAGGGGERRRPGKTVLRVIRDREEYIRPVA